MGGATRFEDLDCWRLANELRTALISFCRRPAVCRDVDFVAQLRGAARSAPNNIAEGFGRRTHRDFAHFLDIARGSLMETESLLREAQESGYVENAEYDQLVQLTRRARGATTALQRYLRATPDPR